MKQLLAISAFAVTTCLGSVASACPNCFVAANKENQIAYLVTTGFMTFLPLLMIGGLIFWVHKRAQALSRSLGEDLPGKQPEA